MARPNPPLLRPAPDAAEARRARVRPAHLRVALLALLLAATVPIAGAQRLVVTAAADAAGPAAATGLEALAIGPLDLDLGLTLRPTSATAPLAVEAALRSNLAFGPLGNVVFRGDARLASDGRAGGSVAAEGSYGPLALELALALASSDRDSFLPTTDPAAVLDPGAGFGEGRLRGSAALAAQLRLAGGWIVELQPELLLLRGDAGWSPGGRLTAGVRLRRARGDDDLALLLRAYAAPVAAARPGAAALGVAYVLNERRAPSWTGTLWLGTGRLPAPGATLVGALRDGPVRLELALAAEPFRSDVAPYRAALRALRAGDAPLTGEWRLSAELQFDADGAARGALSLGYALELGE